MLKRLMRHAVRYVAKTVKMQCVILGTWEYIFSLAAPGGFFLLMGGIVASRNFEAACSLMIAGCVLLVGLFVLDMTMSIRTGNDPTFFYED